MVKRLRVGVVFGGRSAEHEVSVASARNVLEAMDPERYEPVPIGIDREGRWHLDDARRLLESAGHLPALSAGRAAMRPAKSPWCRAAGRTRWWTSRRTAISAPST